MTDRSQQADAAAPVFGRKPTTPRTSANFKTGVERKSFSLAHRMREKLDNFERVERQLRKAGESDAAEIMLREAVKLRTIIKSP